MSDTITLPREVVELALEALEWSWGGEPMGTKEREAITALRAHLAAEQQKQEPVTLAKDWLKMTLRVSQGDRVFKVERWLHLSEIKQSHFPLVPETADLAWQELNAAMKRGDKT